MRVAYLLTRADNDIGGAQIHVRDLSQALLAQGHEVTVLAGGRGKFAFDLAAKHIPFRHIPHLAVPLNPVCDALALTEILRALTRLKPDLVCAHTAKAGFLGRIASAILRIPAIFTPHGWAITDRISAARGRFFRRAEQTAALFSSRIINVCEFEERLATAYRIAPPEKLAVIHNGIADVRENLLADASGEPPVIVMLARFAEPKQHGVLLQALAGLKHLDWRLELLGSGPLEPAVRLQAADLDLAGRVRFRGFCPDTASVLARAQMMVLASRFEAFPYSILEAMRAGLPVLASDVGGVREAVVEGQTGFLSLAGDVAALRNHLAACIANPVLRRCLGQQGRRRYLRLFTLDRMIADTLSVYRLAVHSSPVTASLAMDGSGITIDHVSV